MSLEKLAKDMDELKISKPDPVDLLTKDISNLSNILDLKMKLSAPEGDHSAANHTGDRVGQMGIKKPKSLKHKTVDRKPILSWLQGKSNAESRKWVEDNVMNPKDICDSIKGEDGDKDTDDEECDRAYANKSGELLSEDEDNNTKGLVTPEDSDEINANELASYLDHMLTIPKKMSTMAKMMYI
ncbi:hypothetical protein KR067_007707 [Drosophila pandora]|nr:hypothetical protein KR067_007707 [Drosophila pandora]